MYATRTGELEFVMELSYLLKEFVPLIEIVLPITPTVRTIGIDVHLVLIWKNLFKSLYFAYGIGFMRYLFKPLPHLCTKLALTAYADFVLYFLNITRVNRKASIFEHFTWTEWKGWHDAVNWRCTFALLMEVSSGWLLGRDTTHLPVWITADSTNRWLMGAVYEIWDR